MKMSPLVIALAAAGALFGFQAQAADGVITFNGEITDVTCVIDGAGSGGANFDVTLPTVAAKALSAAGESAGARAFNITVGSAADPCRADNVRVAFEPGGNVDPSTGMLSNGAGTDMATNVQVAVLNADGDKIDLRNNTNSQTVAVDTNGVAVLDFYGQYEAVNGAATAGDVLANARYTVEYP